MHFRRYRDDPQFYCELRLLNRTSTKYCFLKFDLSLSIRSICLGNYSDIIDGLPCRNYIVHIRFLPGGPRFEIFGQEITMEKLIARLSYWLGIACLVIAVIWRIVNIFRFWQSSAGTPGAIGHGAFLHASMLFFVATVATVCYAWLNSQKP